MITTQQPTYGTYRKGLGKGGRARLVLAKKEGGSVKIGKRTYNFGVPKRRLPDYPEIKFFDTQLTIPFPITGACSTSAATGNIHIIPQGDTESSREGRIIRIRSVQLRGVLTYAPAATATASTSVFLVLLMDSQCNGANPAITDVFTTNAMRDNMINLANNKRFKILKRFSFDFASTAGVSTAYNNVSRVLDYYKACNVTITYDNSVTTGAITSTRQNSILMAYGSDASASLVTFNGASRIRFTG